MLSAMDRNLHDTAKQTAASSRHPSQLHLAEAGLVPKTAREALANSAARQNSNADQIGITDLSPRYPPISRQKLD
jgi:hypothetical protein